MSKNDEIATVHKLTVVKQVDNHDSEFDVYFCKDQFDNEWALSKEGEPEYTEWGIYNFIVRNDVCMITTPVSKPHMSWELVELPKNYRGDLQVGMSFF